MKTVTVPRCVLVGLLFFVLSSGCLDTLPSGSPESSGGNSGSCSAGSHIYSTSDGHCCLEGYPYYYDGTCHTCSQGYSKYDTSAGYCCPSGYPYYYDGKCHPCSEGYYKYDTSGGHCCLSGYPYFYDGMCHSQSSGSSSSGSSYSGGTSTVVVDTRTGCPSQSNLECSPWIAAGSCQLQSCTCYYSTRSGDTTAAYYHTSDGAYFRCSGAGQTLSCIAAAQAAAQHCT